MNERRTGKIDIEWNKRMNEWTEGMKKEMN